MKENKKPEKEQQKKNMMSEKEKSGKYTQPKEIYRRRNKKNVKTREAKEEDIEGNKRKNQGTKG